jgi:hypothetical protein
MLCTQASHTMKECTNGESPVTVYMVRKSVKESSTMKPLNGTIDLNFVRTQSEKVPIHGSNYIFRHEVKNGELRSIPSDRSCIFPFTGQKQGRYMCTGYCKMTNNYEFKRIEHRETNSTKWHRQTFNFLFETLNRKPVNCGCHIESFAAASRQSV